MIMKEWRVVVHGLGDIGSVVESNEDNARCAALSKFYEEGTRYENGDSVQPYIYEDDEFSVFESK